MNEARRTPEFPATIARIVLTGFMGAGKTTVGALLAERLGWRFVDSDRVVETRTGMTIAEVFAERGEPAFRVLEAEAIREIAEGEDVVIGLGGGAVERAETRELLAGLADTLVVFLDARLETLVARCAGHEGGPARPVLLNLLDDQARLGERWSQRLPWYREAHMTIDTGELTPEAVAERIARRARESRGPREGAEKRRTSSGVSA